MQKLLRTVRTSLLYAATVLIAGGAPLTAMADTAPATTPAQTTTSSTATAPTSSTSPSSGTTTQTKPKVTYTYNTKTGMWDTNQWQYNLTSGTYEAVPKPPVVITPTTQTAAPATTTTPTGTSTSGTGTPTTNSTTASNSSTTTNGIGNTLSGTAQSGDATVTHNTQAGDATSGNATSEATILNNVNSTISTGDNQKAASFVSNVMGDVHGDILLQPMLLKAMLEAGNTNATQNGSTVTTTNNQLTNNVDLTATSGNATVTGNTSAGNATSGSANTVANVMNIINSMVSANKSFVGTINIYGNLDGDILVAPDFLSQLLASNGGAKASSTANTASTVSSNDTQAIMNNVSLAAKSGQAAVTGNTSAGNATSGSANTNVVLFNLSGHDIVASNSLLVFVNVLGKWVGVIVDAPAGTTAAAIGNGVTTNSTTAPDLVINATTNSQVTNNINLNSQSGDATVSGNTSAGNATSGNATASANIGNVVGTNMNLTGWFGILFINVFGNWFGSFGVDTAAGNRSTTTSGGFVPPRSGKGQPMHVIDFIPHSGGIGAQLMQPPVMTIIHNNGNGGYTTTGVGSQSQSAGTLTSAALPSQAGQTEPSDSASSAQMKAAAAEQNGLRLPWLGGITFLAGLSLVGASKLSDARKRMSSLK